MAMQSPELLLKDLNNALRHLRGASTLLNDEEVDEKLLSVMRRLLLAEILGNTWILAVGGSQGAGKTTLMAYLYDMQDQPLKWLQGNEGRGEKMPILILEEDDVVEPQGYVRRLILDDSGTDFRLQDILVDVAQFQQAVCDPSSEDLLPVLRMPRCYFKRENQAWLLLPGYEKQERANRSWQELMRQAMVAAGGCIVVTDETRMANQQQLEIVKDMLENELKDCKPYIIISKTEAYRHDEKRRTDLKASASGTFQIEPELMDKHIILTGIDDSGYVKEWKPLLCNAIEDLNFSGQSNRHLQMSQLSDITSKELARVLSNIRSKARLYFVSDKSGAESGAEVLEEILEKFDDAVDNLRDEYLSKTETLADKAFNQALQTMEEKLRIDHEGFKNWIGNAFDTTSETAGKMRSLVQDSWQSIDSTFQQDYVSALGKLTAYQLGRQTEEDSTEDKTIQLTCEKSKKLQLGYVHKSGRTVQHSKLSPEIINDVNILLGNNAQTELSSQATSKHLAKCVELLPALTLEYLRIAYILPESLLPKQSLSNDEPSAQNITIEGVESLKKGADLGKTAIRSFAAVLAVDVASDGDSDILGALLGKTSSDGEPGSLPIGAPVVMHPAAIAVTAAIAAAYTTTVAITRLRTYEKNASAQAHNMLDHVRDQHITHLRSYFDQAMKVTRNQVKNKIRERYRMDEAFMYKDRLAKALADATALTNDLRSELESSAVGLQPLLVKSNA